MNPLTLKQVRGYEHAPNVSIQRLALTAIQAIEQRDEALKQLRELKAKRTDVYEREMPQNLDAERAVLGSILLMPSVLSDVTPIVKPQDFYDDAHRKIYEHLLGMNAAIDVLLLSERLKQSGDYEDIGGAAYLAEIGRQVPTASHAKHYAKIVAEKASRRTAIHAAIDTMNEAFEP
jgi:replicative DNA helicase